MGCPNSWLNIISEYLWECFQNRWVFILKIAKMYRNPLTNGFLMALVRYMKILPLNCNYPESFFIHYYQMAWLLHHMWHWSPIPRGRKLNGSRFHIRKIIFQSCEAQKKIRCLFYKWEEGRDIEGRETAFQEKFLIVLCKY